ncbi:DUF899 domain-containing protein [Planctomicrobium sp. SH664]|uniref:DUF899 domain-containing protein n=1 Tax=Planctomicrobium sp. SH664 TaxID=3448125 RepID=UPI003F5B1D11
MTTPLPHPPIASRGEWNAARSELLLQEKELTRQQDRVNAQRRRLPMVLLEKEYRFEGATGSRSLLDLFEGRPQLIIYHFMFDPAWEKGCPGCTGLVNEMGDLSLLNQRNTTFKLVSRAPFLKLQSYRADQGWEVDWYSSFGSDFNYDFHVTLDSTIVPLQHNFRTAAELEERREKEPYFLQGETHGISVFFQWENQVYHTYSAYARGVEGLTNCYGLLDITPFGRQEDFEDSPAGWPQKPTYG